MPIDEAFAVNVRGPEYLYEPARRARVHQLRLRPGDLERFKTFIEAEGYATGAWRGSLNEGAGSGTPTPATPPPHGVIVARPGSPARQRQLQASG